MADFCNQCLADLTGELPDDIGTVFNDYTIFLCERCGPTIVNKRGDCVFDCLKGHVPGSVVQVGWDDLAFEEERWARREEEETVKEELAKWVRTNEDS